MLSPDENTTLRLLRECLEKKWFKGSNEDLLHLCPFCYHISCDCESCLCPVEICAWSASHGFISELHDWYEEEEDVKICDISDEDLNAMRKLFLDKIAELEKKEKEPIPPSVQEYMTANIVLQTKKREQFLIGIKSLTEYDSTISGNSITEEEFFYDKKLKIKYETYEDLLNALL